jgi:hypothetical protein
MARRSTTATIALLLMLPIGAALAQGGGGAGSGAAGAGAAGAGGRPGINTATPASPAGPPPTSGGVIGSYTGTQPADAKASPRITAQSSPPIVPDGVQGISGEQSGSRTGLAKPADD